MHQRASSCLFISASKCKWFMEMPRILPFFRPQLLTANIGLLTSQSIRPLDPWPAERRLYRWPTAPISSHTEDDLHVRSTPPTHLILVAHPCTRVLRRAGRMGLATAHAKHARYDNDRPRRSPMR